MEDGKELIVDEEWYFKLLVSQGPYNVAVYQETTNITMHFQKLLPNYGILLGWNK